MATTTTEATKTKATLLDRTGTGATVLSVLALAVPAGYTAYAASGGVTLSTAADVKSLLSNGIILTIVSAVLGLIGTALNIPGLLNHRNVGRIVATVLSVLMLVGSALAGLLGIMPRANAISNLNDKIQPFAIALRDNCQVPLNQLKDHEVDVLRHAVTSNTGDAEGDQLFVELMIGENGTSGDAATLANDAKALSAGADKLSKMTAPDPKYKDLLDRCIKDLRDQADFLTNDAGSHAIKLPAPFNTVAPQLSLTSLIKGSAGLVALGPNSPIGQLPPGTMQGVVYQAMQQVIDQSKDQQLVDEGNQLVADMKNTLKNNLSPIKVDADAIVGQ